MRPARLSSAAKRRTIFFISDSTAITAETLGQSLLTQFEPLEFDQVTLPFIDTFSKAGRALMQINKDANTKGIRPIVFSTLINPDLRRLFKNSSCIFFDFFDTFISRLESELGMRSSHTIGRYHGLIDDSVYSVRIDAMNYAMGTDDGISTKDYDQAEVILLGVSRSGKTPTCLYLGLQFGIYAANYPLTEETLLKRHVTLPKALVPFRKKLFGLTISPERLQRIRSGRMPNTRYASLSQCQLEVAMTESLFESEMIPFVNVTSMSIEEISATVLLECKLQRRFF